MILMKTLHKSTHSAESNGTVIVSSFEFLPHQDAGAKVKQPKCETITVVELILFNDLPIRKLWKVRNQRNLSYLSVLKKQKFMTICVNRILYSDKLLQIDVKFTYLVKLITVTTLNYSKKLQGYFLYHRHSFNRRHTIVSSVDYRHSFKPSSY